MSEFDQQVCVRVCVCPASFCKLHKYYYTSWLVGGQWFHVFQWTSFPQSVFTLYMLMTSSYRRITQWQIHHGHCEYPDLIGRVLELCNEHKIQLMFNISNTYYIGDVKTAYGQRSCQLQQHLQVSATALKTSGRSTSKTSKTYDFSISFNLSAEDKTNIDEWDTACRF